MYCYEEVRSHAEHSLQHARVQGWQVPAQHVSLLNKLHDGGMIIGLAAAKEQPGVQALDRHLAAVPFTQVHLHNMAPQYMIAPRHTCTKSVDICKKPQLA